MKIHCGKGNDDVVWRMLLVDWIYKQLSNNINIGGKICRNLEIKGKSCKKFWEIVEGN